MTRRRKPFPPRTGARHPWHRSDRRSTSPDDLEAVLTVGEVARRQASTTP